MAGSGTAHMMPTEEALLRVEHLVVEFPHGVGEKVHAVSDVSLDVRPGETLGIVGESGCGKSTLARTIMQLIRPKSGSVTVAGKELTALGGKRLREARLSVQMIFQDPISSLNPRRKVRDIVADALGVVEAMSGTNGHTGSFPRSLTHTRAERRTEHATRVDEVLSAVGLDPDAVGNRRPREFSGGQCQRVCIARAVVMEPSLLICDEPVSALDVSVQAQILNLLEAMKERYGLTMVFIAHDLAVVKNISDRIAVMYLGKLCEISPADELYASPFHPYTVGLLDAIPEPDPESGVSTSELIGDAPSPTHPPTGCRFRTRCPRATELCAEQEPVVRELAPAHFVACHHPMATNGALSQ
jgi:peptide/nickel transport system ATP-binding protein